MEYSALSLTASSGSNTILNYWTANNSMPVTETHVTTLSFISNSFTIPPSSNSGVNVYIDTNGNGSGTLLISAFYSINWNVTYFGGPPPTTGSNLVFYINNYNSILSDKFIDFRNVDGGGMTGLGGLRIMGTVIGRTVGF